MQTIQQTIQPPLQVAQVGDILYVHEFKPSSSKRPSKPFIGLGRNGDEPPELDEEALTRWGNAIPRVEQRILVQGMTVQISGIPQELAEKHRLARIEKAHVVEPEGNGFAFKNGDKLRLTDLPIGTQVTIESLILVEL